MSLYRTYRPQTFADVVDQRHIVTTLQMQYAKGVVGHAYLFCGPRGVGKTTVARILAKLLNCNAPVNNEPCNQCEECRNLAGAHSMKILEIDAASNRSIDDVRELRDIVRVARQSKGQFVVIIDEVHMLTPQAFNALLKTLEEPPERVVFVLATTEVHQIPATILSRCQRFDFHRIALPEMKKLLTRICKEEKVIYDEEVLDRIIRHADGYGRDALVLLEQCIVISGDSTMTLDTVAPILPHAHYDKALELFESIAARDVGGALRFVDTWYKNGINLQRLHADSIEYIRLLSLYEQKAIGDELLFDVTRSSSLIPKLRLISPLFKILSVFLRTIELYSHAPLPTLPLELTIFELLGSGDTSGIDNGTKSTSAPLKEKEVIKPAKTSLPTIDLSDAPKPITQKEPELPVIQLDLMDLNRRWAGFVDHLRQTSPSLSLMLQHIHPERYSENTLILATRITMYRDRLHEPKIRETLCVAWVVFFGTKLTYTVEVVGEDHMCAYEEAITRELQIKKNKDQAYLGIVGKELGLT